MTIRTSAYSEAASCERATTWELSEARRRTGATSTGVSESTGGSDVASSAGSRAHDVVRHAAWPDPNAVWGALVFGILL